MISPLPPVPGGENRRSCRLCDGDVQVDEAVTPTAFAGEELLNQVRVSLRPRPRVIASDLVDDCLVHLPQQFSSLSERLGQWPRLQCFPEQFLDHIDRFDDSFRTIDSERQHLVVAGIALGHFSEEPVERSATFERLELSDLRALELRRGKEPNDAGTIRRP